VAFEDATGPDCCCIPNPPCGGIAGRVIGCNPSFGEPPFGEVPLVRGPFTGTAAGPGGRTYRVLINLGGGYQVQVLDDDGFYRGSLPAGDYTITISGPGYFPRTFVVHHVCGTPDNLPVYMHPTVLRFALGAACLGLKDATVTLGGIYSGAASLGAWSYFTGPNYLDVPVSDPGGDPNTLPGCFTATLSMPRYESVEIEVCWTTSGLVCRNSLSPHHDDRVLRTAASRRAITR
jgi:hypothetical protein